jgi:hypothetical protein
MKLLDVLVVLFPLLLAAKDPSILVIGEISDSQCAFNVHSSDGSHAAMIKTDTLGRNAAECTRKCVLMGGKYVLVDTVNNRFYRLANPERVVSFAAMKVRVRGVVEGKDLLLISSIEAR